jgi:hypothetical protein
MADRTINYYEFLGHEPDWARLKRTFKRNVSEHNVPFFTANSDAEQEFLRFCEAANLRTQRKTIIEFDHKTTETDRFIYLVAKNDDGACVAENATRFLDLSTACPGGGAFGTCGRFAKQVDRVPLIPTGLELVTRLGLVSASHPSVPRIYLLSVAVADALRTAGATGCEIVPTNTPNCCQLRVITETAGPARIGQARMGKQCPICGVAKLFFGSSERCFHPGDLSPADFQNCRFYEADNVGQFEILNGFPIISQRIFHLLSGLKVRGLGRYSTDPPIQNAVVQVHDP